MPLSTAMKQCAENEIRIWTIETGLGLKQTGNMKDQVRTLTAEVLYRRMILKFPDEMAGYSLDDLKSSVFEDGDYFSNNWLSSNILPGAKTIIDDGRLRDEEKRRLSEDLPPYCGTSDNEQNE